MGISLLVDAADTVNYAACHCGAPLIRNVRILNGDGKKVILRIYAEPAFCFEYKEELELTDSEETVSIKGLRLDDGFYRKELLDSKEGALKVQILDGEDRKTELAFVSKQVHLQPYLHWNRTDYEDTLAAFLQPNEPMVTRIMKNAAEIAKENGCTMVGYMRPEEDPALKQAACIFEALRQEKLSYLLPMAGFEFESGQKIRIPHLILQDKVRQGTCLDLAILYATCLEAASLHAVLFLVPGHAFTGVWTGENYGFEAMNFKDENVIRQSCLEGSLVPVECTLLRDDVECSFEEAVQSAQQTIMNPIHNAMDISVSRLHQVTPAFTFTDQPICGTVDVPTVDEKEMKAAASQFTKLDRLLSEAMDLTLRNRLLSGIDETSCVKFSVSSDHLMDHGYEDLELVQRMREQYPDAKALEELLNSMAAVDRQSRKQTGNGILYLMADELRWRPEGQEKECCAPLYFCPAELYRNVRGDYVFRTQTEQWKVNPVLTEYLRQNCQMDLSNLLEKEETYSKRLECLKYVLEQKPEWEVVNDTVTLAVCKMPNEAIWRELQTPELAEHEIVRGLLDGVMSWENTLGPEEEEKIVPVYAFQADYSQREVIRAVREKKALAVTGPAGSGKSQTIANLLAEGMRTGKHILFVTEKLAAMSVVQERLEEIGLDRFSLMLPDGGNSMGELKKKTDQMIWYLSEKSQEAPYKDSYEKQYRAAFSKLNGYANAMKTPGRQGTALTDLLEKFEEYRDVPGELDAADCREALTQESSRHLMKAYQDAKLAAPQESAEYLGYLKFAGMTDDEVKQGQTEARRALTAYDRLQDSSAAFEKKLGLNLGEMPDKTRIPMLLKYASFLLKCPTVGPGLEQPVERSDSEDLMSLAHNVMSIAPGTALYAENDEKLWQAIEKRTSAAVSSDSDDLWQLQQRISSSMGSSYQMTEAQREFLARKAKFDSYLESLQDLVEKNSHAYKMLNRAAFLIAAERGLELVENCKRMLMQYRSYSEAQKAAEPLVIAAPERFAEDYPTQMSTVLLKTWTSLMDENAAPEQKAFRMACQKLEEAGLGTMLRQIEQKISAKEMEPSQILASFDKCRCRFQIAELQKDMPQLRDFAQTEYSLWLQQYQESERLLRKELRRTLPDQIRAYLPDMSQGISDSSEMGEIQKFLRRKDSKGSPRELFEKAPNVIRQMFPCIMMGPGNVAEFLPAGEPLFDLVIFDEASQLPTYKALIPVSRGRQVLFFGDEQQLTPTSFFQKNYLDENGMGVQTEPVLEDAIITSMPQKMLRCHYRSKYESLMAFSNEHYYQGKIVTFPDPFLETPGIHWEYVEDGCYDRGGTRTNRREAERVLELLHEIYEKLPEDTEETAGVITFNVEQANLIRNMLCEARRQDENFDERLDRLVDVVNLEACQGREWERTILSMTYGKDSEGKFSTNLGPMSQEDSGHRLNVMITRSREEIFVVSSMVPEMFEGSESRARDVKEFLAYVRGDRKTAPTEPLMGKKKFSGIIAEVAKRLMGKGYKVLFNVGNSSCKVNLAISFKGKLKFQVGIVVDHYANALYSVWDQELMVPEMLENKGWKIYRLHAMNWYQNPEHEMQQILKLLEEE